MILTRRTFLACAAAATAAPALPARAAATRSLGGAAFGSYWRATLPSGASTDAARARIAGIIAGVDMLMSPYRPDSDLGRFNALSTTVPVPLAPETAEVTRAALAIADETGGAFDPTVGPIVARYGFGPIEGAEGGGAALLTLEGADLSKARPDLTLDLCGIAKGHALDRITQALADLGLDDFVVELGGEVAARGRHPEGRAWQIGLDDAHGGLARIVALADTAVATSGDAVQGYELGAARYGHIVDPEARAPVTGSLVSVSVFHASALRADALATALFAMGRERAEAFARATRTEAVLLTREGDRPHLIATGGAEARLLAETDG